METAYQGDHACQCTTRILRRCRCAPTHTPSPSGFSRFTRTPSRLHRHDLCCTPPARTQYGRHRTSGLLPHPESGCPPWPTPITPRTSRLTHLQRDGLGPALCARGCDDHPTQIPSEAAPTRSNCAVWSQRAPWWHWSPILPCSPRDRLPAPSDPNTPSCLTHLERDGLGPALCTRGGDDHVGPRVHDAPRQRLRREAAEHHAVHRADARAGQLVGRAGQDGVGAPRSSRTKAPFSNQCVSTVLKSRAPYMCGLFTLSAPLAATKV